MTTGVKVLLGTVLGFLAVAYSWIFRAKKVQSGRGQKPSEGHW